MKSHTFAITAYQDSPYLEACIKSLKGQTVQSRIILCTSTPSPYIQNLADQYHIPVFIREGESDIQKDWNFAYHMADTQLVTIAHQDDMYHREYGITVQKKWDKYPDTIVFTTSCVIVKNGRIKSMDKVGLVKKLLRFPLRIPAWNHLKAVKKSVLLFGNPVICPSCTYNKEVLGEPLFCSPYKFALDWDTMLRLADRRGRWICEEAPLLFYRIHDGAATSVCIRDNRRNQEEEQMFQRIWPAPLAKLILHFYQKAENAYK